MRKCVTLRSLQKFLTVFVDAGKHSNELLLERDHSVMEV